MSIKRENQTLSKAGADEEIFVLRGQDLSAPQTIAFWIAQNITNDGCGEDKLREALECALRMRRMAGRRAAD